MPVSLGNAKIIKETNSAIQVELEDPPGVHWIPKSVVHDNSEVWETVGTTGDLIIQEWFAEKEGFI